MAQQQIEQQSPVVTCEVRIEARPEIVFSYFSDPERMARWLGTSVTADARPGGKFQTLIGDKHSGSGEFIEIDPPRRIVQTFGWDEPGHPIPSGSTRVEIDLIPDGKGTLVRLRHSGLPLDAVSDHTHGWNHFLGRLAIAATGGDPGPHEVQ